MNQFIYEASSIKYQASRIRHQTSSIKNRTSSITHQASSNQTIIVCGIARGVQAIAHQKNLIYNLQVISYPRKFPHLHHSLKEKKNWSVGRMNQFIHEASSIKYQASRIRHQTIKHQAIKQ